MTKQNQHTFDKLINQTLQEGAPAAGSWDLPSEGVWEGISSALVARRRRRRFLILWLFVGFGLIGFGALLLSERPDAEPLQQLESSKAGHQAGLGLQQTTPDAGLSPVTSELVKDIDPSQEELSNQPVINASKIGSETGQIVESQTSEARHVLTESSSNFTDQRSVVELSDTRRAALDENLAGQPTNLRLADQNKTQVTKHSSQSLKENRLEENTTTAKSSPLDSKPIMAAGNALPERIIASDQRAQARIAVFIPSIDDLHPGITTASRTSDLTTVPAPVTSSTTKPGRLFVGLYYAPSISSRAIHVARSRPNIRRRQLRQQEITRVGSGLDMDIALQISKHWYIGLGIGYQNTRFFSRQNKQIRYSRAGEVAIDQDRFRNNLNTTINTSLGNVSGEVIIERSNDQLIRENDFVNFQLSTKVNLHALTIPLSVKYENHLGRLRYRLGAGLAFTTIFDQQVGTVAIKSLNDQVRDARIRTSDRLQGLETNTFQYQFGAGLVYPVTSSTLFVFEPTFSQSFKPVFQKEELSTFSSNTSFRIGIQYRLN